MFTVCSQRMKWWGCILLSPWNGDWTGLTTTDLAWRPQTQHYARLNSASVLVQALASREYQPDGCFSASVHLLANRLQRESLQMAPASVTVLAGRENWRLDVQYFSTCAGKEYEQMAVRYFSVYFSRENINRWLFSTSVCVLAKCLNRWLFGTSVCTFQERISTDGYSVLHYIHVLAKSINKCMFGTSVCSVQERISTDGFSVLQYMFWQSMNRWLFGTSVCTVLERISTDGCLVLQNVYLSQKWMYKDGCVVSLHMYLPSENINKWLFTTSADAVCRWKISAHGCWIFLSTCICRERISTVAVQHFGRQLQYSSITDSYLVLQHSTCQQKI